jgi:effector-binding domain-containing protein
MFQEVDRLRKELYAWLAERHLEEGGPSFLRYHVIDMGGLMDVEFGVPISETTVGDERVSRSTLPKGRYACVVYVGHGLAANKALIGWARAEGIEWDRWNDPKGDGFRARCETYLTDFRNEPRKTKWKVELAIKVDGV